MTKILSFSNFFTELYFLHPVSDKTVKELKESDREIVLISTIALGIFTLGTIHLGGWIIEKCITPAKKKSQVDDRIEKTYTTINPGKTVIPKKEMERVIPKDQKKMEKVEKKKPVDPKNLGILLCYSGVAPQFYNTMKPALEAFIEEFPKALFSIQAWGSSRKNLDQDLFDEIESNNPDNLPVVHIILQHSTKKKANSIENYHIDGGICTVFMNAANGKLIEGGKF